MTPRSLAAALFLSLPAVSVAQNVAEVQVAPPSVTIKVGERTGLLATAFDRAGNVIPTVRFIWSSNSLVVARVDNNGTVTGVAAGVAIVEARVGSRKGQAAVQVIGGGPAPTPTPPRQEPAAQPSVAQPPATEPGGGGASVDPYVGQPAGIGSAAAMRIDPPAIYLLPSENTRVFPRALRDDGSPAAPVRVTWKSLREDIASVDQNGNVVALSTGQGTIQVTGPNGLTATAPVVVAPAELAIQEPTPVMLSPGDVDTLHVIVPTQNARLVNPLALQWTSSDPTVASVNILGVVRAAGSGKAVLTMTGLLQTRTVDVAVHRAVQSLEIRPRSSADVQVPVTSAVRFFARALAADNTPVVEAPLRWSVADTSIVSFDVATGMLTGRKIGKTQVTVRGPGQGLAVTWNVNVIAGALKLAATRVGLPLNGRYTIKASFADEAGAVIGPASGVTWASDNAQVAGVGEDGTVAGVGYGRAKITATAPGGKTTTADVFVQGEIVVSSSRGGKFQLYSAERSNLAQLHRVSQDTATAMDPSLSADGSRIAFVSSRDGNPEIYVMDVDGSNAVRLTNDPQADSRPVFLDAQTIVFASQRTGRQQLWTVGIDGSGLKQLTLDSASSSPAVSPDGQTIAYVALRNKNYDIWLMSRDGSNQRAFTKSPAQKESEPRFLRDGSLAYLVERLDNGRTVQQVAKADLATGAVSTLTGTEYAIAGFAISPAGDLLALVVNAQPENRRNPMYKVFIQPVGAGTAVPMPTTGAEQMVTPTFLPLP
jgi:uncharacterized protein YjdB